MLLSPHVLFPTESLERGIRAKSGTMNGYETIGSHHKHALASTGVLGISGWEKANDRDCHLILSRKNESLMKTWKTDSGKQSLLVIMLQSIFWGAPPANHLELDGRRRAGRRYFLSYGLLWKQILGAGTLQKSRGENDGRTLRQGPYREAVRFVVFIGPWYYY